MDRHEKLHEFLRQHYYTELMKASKEENAALVIDFGLLDRFDPLVADQLLATPDGVFDDFAKAVKAFDVGTIPVRVRNLPERRHIRVRSLRAEHIGQFIATDVIVKSASEVKPQISEAIFKCPECERLIPVAQEDALLLKKASICDGCGRRGEFPLVEKKMIDIRWLKGVEPFEITQGEQPSEIAIFLSKDLVTPRLQRKTDPGSRLRLYGVLKELPKRIKGKMTTKMDTFLDVNWFESTDIEYEELEITPEDEAKILALAHDPKIYERLRASIAPGIWGHDEVKEAIALQLFGGILHILPDGSRVRGNIHILLTGDPSVGKTQLLKLAASIVPRGKYVSGSGVTGAGLTATVRKDEVLGSWVLEAGALILCNRGLISIDEFDKMSKDDQIAMHEATSVETVSIAKASIVATLPAQTAVLAGANPKLGRFDPYRTIIEQIDIPETLLSRFDLKFVLRDIPDRGKDEKLADHVIVSRITPQEITPEIEVSLLRKYLAYARQRVTSLELTPEAAKMIKDFYVDMRNAAPESGVVSITLRQYEALLRLAEASAKVRLDTHVRVEDAERAIRLMKFSLMQLGFDKETGQIDIDRIESGIGAAQRSKIRTILDIIETLQKQAGGKEVAYDDVLAEAESQGVERADEVIDKLKREGMIFEPRSGFIKKL
ncbi:MAG: minichromosome maintenance protein MCM [Candidatus Aenigmatarchaeota archaeon]